MPVETIISCGSIIVAIVAVVFAWWSAHEARVANKKAEEANNLAKEANKISQQALELQERHSPAPWSAIIREGDYSCLLENRSGKDAVITQIQAFPEKASDLLRVIDLPKYVAYGDSYQFLIFSAMESIVETIEINWYFVDDPEKEYEVVRNVNLTSN